MNEPVNDRYARRGVSSSKSEVHQVVDKLDRGLFPGAFCKITHDVLTADPNRCVVIHADGSGTKSILAYLHYRETGDPSWFRKTAQDSIVMNLDDLLCVGATEGILFSNTVNRNARAVPGEALAELIQGTEDFLALLRSLGVGVHSGGGETADVGDLTPTVTVDSCAVASLRRDAVVDNACIVPGLAIVGLASSGRASYEQFENSGIGSNGLTSARHDLLASYYRDKYPETCDSRTARELLYCGPYRLENALPGSSLSVGEALSSPTRSYAPVIVKLLRTQREALFGLVHCSGGGQTKCLRFGTGVHIVKDALLPIPAVFSAIQKASATTDEEMYRVYNMGHRMEIYCARDAVEGIISIANDYGIEAALVGRTEVTCRADGANHLTIVRDGKELRYG
jgi:phosphoribosylformylglycinamidine cyclo-ligase